MDPESAFTHRFIHRGKKKSKTCFDLYLEILFAKKEAKQFKLNKAQPVFVDDSTGVGTW